MCRYIRRRGETSALNPWKNLDRETKPTNKEDCFLIFHKNFIDDKTMVLNLHRNLLITDITVMRRFFGKIKKLSIRDTRLVLTPTF